MYHRCPNFLLHFPHGGLLHLLNALPDTGLWIQDELAPPRGGIENLKRKRMEIFSTVHIASC
jgi:hypothetical protein